METTGSLEHSLQLKPNNIEAERLALLDIQTEQGFALYALDILDIVYDNTRLKIVNDLTRPVITMSTSYRQRQTINLLGVKLETPVLKDNWLTKEYRYTHLAQIVDNEIDEVFYGFSNRQVEICFDLAKKLVRLSETSLPHI